MGVGGQRQVPAALPPEKTRYPLCRNLGVSQRRFRRVRKSSPPPRSEYWTAESVASRYTAYGILAHLILLKA
jgi:hypothetical protein